MGGAAVPGPVTYKDWIGFPDLDALFRIRARVDDWTWKAPSLVPDHDSSPITQETTSLQAGRTVQSPFELVPKLAQCMNLSEINNLLSSASIPPDRFENFSRIAFARLLELKANEKNGACYQDVDQLGDIFYFLQSDLDDPRAHNLQTLVTWMDKYNASYNAIQHLLAITVDKLQLCTLRPQELPMILGSLANMIRRSSILARVLLPDVATLTTSINGYCQSSATSAQTDELTTHVLTATVDFMTAFPPCQRTVTVALETSQDLWSRTDSDGACMSAVVQCMNQWMQSLQVTDVPELLPEIIRGLMTDNDDSTADVTNLRSFPWLAEIIQESTNAIVAQCQAKPEEGPLLLAWLKTLRRCRFVGHPAVEMFHGTYSAIAKCFPAHYITSHWTSFNDARPAARLILRHWQSPKLAYISDEPLPVFQSENDAALRDKFRFYPNVARCSMPIYSPIIDTIRVLSGFKRFIDPALTSEVFEVMMQGHTPQQVFTAFHKYINRRDVPILPNATAVNLIHFFLRTANGGYAKIVWNNIFSVQISDCPQLFLALLDTKVPNAEMLFGMLNRIYPGNTVPLAERDLPENSLTPEHVQLVHLMAHKYAHNRYLSPRESFTRVYECYRYLQDRRVPLSPLLVRAFVHAGVTRYLEEGIWVSTVRFSWTLKMVREVEGAEVADRLDRMAYAWRSKNAESPESAKRQLIHEFRLMSKRAIREAVDVRASHRRWRRVQAKGPSYESYRRRIAMEIERGDRKSITRRI